MGNRLANINSTSFIRQEFSEEYYFYAVTFRIGFMLGAIQTDVVVGSSLFKGRLGGICGAGKFADVAVGDDRKSPSIPLFQRGKQYRCAFPHQFESHPLMLGIDRKFNLAHDVSAEFFVEHFVVRRVATDSDYKPLVPLLREENECRDHAKRK